jgi:hypothetical protein
VTTFYLAISAAIKYDCLDVTRILDIQASILFHITGERRTTGLIPPLTEESNSLVENHLWLSLINQLINEEADKILEYARFTLSQRELSQ